VSKLSKLDELVQKLQEDEQINRFKELEQVIDQNEELQQKFKRLLDLQKIMVQHEVKDHKEYPTSKAAYDQMYQDITDHLIVEEYLELLNYINDEINMIQTIIEQEIAKDFD